MDKKYIEHPQNDGKTAKQRAKDKYNEKNKTMTACISNDIFNMFEEYCKNTQQTKKQVLEAALSEYIDNH